MKLTTTMGVVLLGGAAACGVAWAMLPSFQGADRTVQAEAALRLERARRLLHQYDAELAYTGTLVTELRKAGVDGASGSPADRARLLDRNERLLQQASQAIEQAMAVRVNDVSGRDLPGVMRLQGAIQFYRGLAERTRAGVRRLSAVPLQSELTTLANRAASLKARQSLVSDSGIAAHITTMQQKVDHAELAVSDLRRKLTGWDQSIADIEQRIASASARRENARAQLHDLREQGIDFSKADAAADYKQAYLAADRAYREAQRQVQYLTNGHFPRAEIDASGDFLTGRYLENGSPFGLTIQPGLIHFQNERAAVAAALAKRESEVTALRATVERLKTLRQRYATDEADARDELNHIHLRAADALAEWSRIHAEADSMEDAALAQFDRAARAARDASTQAGRWVSDAQTRLQGVSPAAAERSAFSARRDDAWMGGFMLAQAADARLARAWVFYDRFQAATVAADLLDRIAAPLNLAEADAAEERAKANEAREAGVEEVKLAMADLQRAHRDVERHWTVVAQAAGTQYLLALFGDESYVNDTIESYRSAIQDREDASYAQPFVNRLRQLESR